VVRFVELDHGISVSDRLGRGIPERERAFDLAIELQLDAFNLHPVRRLGKNEGPVRPGLHELDRHRWAAHRSSASAEGFDLRFDRPLAEREDQDNDKVHERDQHE